MRRLGGFIIVFLASCGVVFQTSSGEQAVGPERTIAFPSNCRTVTRLSFSPDGKVLLMQVWHQMLRDGRTTSLWLWREGRKIAEFKDKAHVYAFINESELIAAGSELQIIKNVLERPEWVSLATAQADGKPGPLGTYYTCVALAPCRTRFAVGRNDGVVEIWDLKTSKKLQRLQQGTWVKYVAYSNDGSYLVSLGGAEKSTHFVPAEPGIQVIGEVIAWDCNKNYQRLGSFSDRETTYVRLATYSNEGSSAVLGFQSVRLGILRPDGGIAGTSAVVPTLVIFNLPKVTKLREISLWPDVPGGIHIQGDLAVSPDKKILAIGLAGGYKNPNAFLFREQVYNEVMLFELPNLREVVRMRKGNNKPEALAFSPDGKYLAISYTRELEDLVGKPFVDIWPVEALLKTHSKKAP